MTADTPDPVLVTGAAFDEFYRREIRNLVGLAYVLTGRTSLSEELAQEAMLAAYRGWGRIGAYDDPGAWVRRVVANKAVSAWRRRLAEVRGLSRVGLDDRVSPPPLEPADEQLWAHVRELPARQAQAVALRYLDDRPTGEIAEILGCAEATVRVLLHRAHRTLAERLGTGNDDPAEDR